MGDIQNLQEEIRLLKEREASLQRQLMLERERRLRAERIIQNEKNACMELKSLLEQQDKKFRATIALPPSSYCVRDRAISVSEVPKMLTDQQRTIITPDFDLMDSAPSLLQQNRRPRSHTGNRIVDNQQQARVRSQSAKLGNRRITIDNADMCNSTGGDFATSVFTELPEDLQEILSPSLGEEESHTNQLMRLAVEAGNDKELLQLLKQNGLITDPVNDDGSTLLHIAAIKGHLRCVKVLMDWGMDPNLHRKGQVTPLMDACTTEHLNCVKLLLERGGNYKMRDAKGWNALYWAISKGSLSCVQFLLEHSLEYGDFIIEMEGATSTVLHVAVESRQPAILHVLLTHLTSNYGAVDGKGSLAHLVNAKDKHGSTPAHVAAGVGCTDCLELLCACSVTDLSLKDQWSRTAVDVATVECKEILANRDCQEVRVALDLSEDLEPLVHTIINTIHVFKYHRWSDFDVLVGDALALHCQDLCKRNLSTRNKPLSGCSSAGSLAGLPNGSSSCTNSPTSTSKHKANRKASPLEIIEETVSAYSNLGLATTSICNYKVGLVTWEPGESPPNRHENCDTPFELFYSHSVGHSADDDKLPTLYVKLQGTNNGRLDQLSYETMIPLDTLQGYLELLEKSQCVIVHGPHGCGKTYLSRHLGKCLLKCKNGDPLSGLVHISLHPNFKRDDLLRLFHIHGALVAASGSNEGNLTSSEGSQSSLQNSTLSSNGEHSRCPKVFLLDDIDRVCMPEVIGELLNAFHHRGPAYPVWVDTVQSRTRDTCYHANHYYLRSDCYFIATVTTTGHSREFNRPFHETFMHIWLSTNKEPVTGILHRQLMRKLIHTYNGQIPHHSDPVYAAVQWISEVWQLLNYYINKMGLLEVLAGPRHFLYCPVERNRPDFVYKWLIELWNHQLVPMIRDVTVYGTPLSQGGRQDTTAQILTTLTQRAIKPTCPLENEATVQFICQLEGGQEGINMIEDAKKNRRNLTPSPRAEQRIQTSPGKRWGSNSPLVHQRKHSIEDHHIHVKQTSDSSVEFGHSNGVLSDSPGSTMDRLAQRLVATPESSTKQLVPIDERYGEIAYNRNTSHSSSSTTDKETELPIVKTPSTEKKRNRFGRMLGKFSRDKKINDGSPPMKGSSKRTSSLSSETPGKPDQIQATSKADFDDFFDMVLKATSERIDDQRTAAPNISFYSRTLENSSKTMTSHSLPDLLQEDSSEEITDTMAEVHPIAVTRSSTALNNKNSLLEQQDLPRTENNKRSTGITHSLHIDSGVASAELLNNSLITSENAVSKSETHLSMAKPVKFATSPSMARMDILVQDTK